MARPGPAQKDQKIGRTPNGDWTLVVDVAFKAPKRRDLPKLLLGAPIRPEVRKWWNNLKAMPHCVLWSESDWDYAFDTAVLKQGFYDEPRATLAAEVRHREDQMGTTVEARRKLGIRYVEKDASAAPSTSPGVTRLDDRRARLTNAS